MTTRVPGIPAITKDNLLQVANAVKEVIEVREGVRGDPLDKAVTFRDLAALKLCQHKDEAPVLANIDPDLPVQPYPGVAPGAFKPDNYDESSDLSTPPAPTNLQATGAYSDIYLSWQYPAYRNHAYTEVYRSATDDLGTAQIIGTSASNLYSDPVGTEQKYYYWVRNVSQANVISPYNSTAGTYAETAIDVARRIAELEQETLNDPLAQDLSSRIQLLENSNTSFITELRRIEAGQASLTSQVVAQDLNNRSAIEVSQTAIAGVKAQYTVKIDLNGHVSGFGLASTIVNGTPTSAFIVRADKFAIVDPASTSNNLTNTPSADTVPFQVVNGQTFIKAAFIQDATITNAKIFSVAANKITAGTVTAAIDLQAPVVRSGPVIPNQAGFYLGDYNGAKRFYVGNGSTGISGRSLEFDGSNTIVRGDIYAYNGIIGGNQLTSSYIQSTNYVSNTSGWRLDSNGNLFANNGTFRGNITGASGTFSGAITATSGTIGGNTITANGIYSPNFADGVSGWGIDSAGQAQFNNVVIRGFLQSTSIYTGSIYRDLTSNQQIFSVAGTGTNQSFIADTTTPYTNSSLRLYGPNYHSSAPVRQRVRNTNNGVLIVVTVVATATVDHFFSIWYRYNGTGSWTPVTQVVEPQGGDGSAAITFTTTLGISNSDYLDFAVSGSNTSGGFQDGGKRYLKELTVGITAVNL